MKIKLVLFLISLFLLFGCASPNDVDKEDHHFGVDNDSMPQEDPGIGLKGSSSPAESFPSSNDQQWSQVNESIDPLFKKPRKHRKKARHKKKKKPPTLMDRLPKDPSDLK